VPHVWSSTHLHNAEFSEDKTSFYADDCAVVLSEDGTSYTIRSMNDENCIVNLTVTRIAPGFQAGKTGKTLYGANLDEPWGSMHHAFWPRCAAEGTITTKDGPVDFKGKALFSHALQGMKPHHAAAKWNFCDFQGPTFSGILMQYTTPPSYGSTVVNVGGIVKDDEIVFAGCSNEVTHIETKSDNDNDWPEPTTIKFAWSGTTKDGKAVEAVIEGALEDRIDRIDVMEEVPGFVKKIVAGAVGTKPYIYQVCRFPSHQISPSLAYKILVLPSKQKAITQDEDRRRGD
jgi:Svf1-like C-terminal lipocalin-like domain/Svf1-like N-terminal lipocalin domain